MSYQRDPRKGGYSGGGGGGTGYKPTKKANPFPMQTHFLPETTYRIHRDVMHMRIRQHLGNNATSRYGYSPDGRLGNTYRAERMFTQHELDDLVRDSEEYLRDPDSFQRRLDQRVWDYSEWTDEGQPGASANNPRNRQRADSGGQSSGNTGYGDPRYTGSSTDQGGYGNQYGYDNRYGGSNTAGRGGYDTSVKSRGHPGQSQAGGYGGHPSGAELPSYGQGSQPSGYAGATTYGVQASYGASYGADPSSMGGAYAQNPNTGTYSGADQFLEGMSQPQQGYQGNTSGVDMSSKCQQCGKRPGKCICNVIGS